MHPVDSPDEERPGVARQGERRIAARRVALCPPAPTPQAKASAAHSSGSAVDGAWSYTGADNPGEGVGDRAPVDVEELLSDAVQDQPTNVQRYQLTDQIGQQLMTHVCVTTTMRGRNHCQALDRLASNQIEDEVPPGGTLIRQMQAALAGQEHSPQCASNLAHVAGVDHTAATTMRPGRTDSSR